MNRQFHATSLCAMTCGSTAYVSFSTAIPTYQLEHPVKKIVCPWCKSSFSYRKSHKKNCKNCGGPFE